MSHHRGRSPSRDRDERDWRDSSRGSDSSRDYDRDRYSRGDLRQSGSYYSRDYDDRDRYRDRDRDRERERGRDRDRDRDYYDRDRDRSRDRDDRYRDDRYYSSRSGRDDRYDRYSRDDRYSSHDRPRSSEDYRHRDRRDYSEPKYPSQPPPLPPPPPPSGSVPTPLSTSTSRIGSPASNPRSSSSSVPLPTMAPPPVVNLRPLYPMFKSMLTGEVAGVTLPQELSRAVEDSLNSWQRVEQLETQILRIKQERQVLAKKYFDADIEYEKCLAAYMEADRRVRINEADLEQCEAIIAGLESGRGWPDHEWSLPPPSFP